MNFETISGISQIIGTITIVGGTLFAVIQLSELKKQRRDAIASEIMRTFISKELANAISLLRNMPDGVSAEELRRAGPDTEKAAILICTTFETMGLLVFHRIASFTLVVELAGGIIVVMWHKLGPWLKQMRIEQSQPSWAEWFQWLAQQCERHKDNQAPAYAKHSAWTPERGS